MTVSAGLYLLAIWLIEYDISAPGGTVSKPPRTVISGHGLLAFSGLLVWIGYLIVDRDMLAWIALATLVAVIVLGPTMLGRWILVRRALAGPARPLRDVFARAPWPRPSRATSRYRWWPMGRWLSALSPWCCSSSSESAVADHPARAQMSATSKR
jgi:hypothetical protein